MPRDQKPELPFVISLTCKDSGHPNATVQVSAFSWTESEGWYVWAKGASSHQVITEEGVVTDHFDVAAAHIFGRDRFTFRCKLCGVNVALRSETLFPMLDRLRKANVRTLDLLALDRYSGR